MSFNTSLVRVYLKVESQIKTFYWVALGNDKSVYFGSSLTKNFTKGFCGKNEVKQGVVRLSGENARSMSQEEIQRKYSLHNSGIFIEPYNNGKERKRSRTLRLVDYHKAIPLVAIIPRRLSKYPQTVKKIRENDLIIDVTKFEKQPFSISLYIKEPHQSVPSNVYSEKEFDMVQYQTTELGSFQLGAIVYARTASFNNWPEMEYSCTPEPEKNTKELPWVVFTEF